MGILKDFKKLYGLFSKREKVNSFIMLGLIVLGSVLATFSVGVIFPFTTILLDQESAERYPILQTITEIPWIGGHRRFVVLMCIALILVFAIKSLYTLFLVYIKSRFTLNRQIEMQKKLFQSYIYKPYEFYFKKSTAELKRNIGLVSKVIQGMLMTGLQLITDGLTILFLSILLFVVDPISSTVIVVMMGAFATLYYTIVKSKLDKTAKKQNEFNLEASKAMLEAMGGIKDIRVYGRESSFVSRYEHNSRGNAKLSIFLGLISQSPRIFIETIAFSGLLILVVVNVLRNPEISGSLPMLAVYGMAALRIMPGVNNVIVGITTIRFNNVHFNLIFDDLLEVSQVAGVTDTEDIDITEKCMKFEDKIEIKGMTYRYPGTEKIILDDVDVTIKKGEMVGVVGHSGGGKTTLVDIILGLLPPEKGGIFVDGVGIEEEDRSWRRNIGYVPQNIFIVNGSVTANVTLGVPEEKIDTERVWAALETANLKEFVESLDEKLETNVGQSGIRLSGGQRQRLGIARALYHDPSVLVFDEATSALDNDSEQAITEAIGKIGNTKTMIIIAHRLNTLEKCNVIYEVKNKKVVRKSGG